MPKYVQFNFVKLETHVCGYLKLFISAGNYSVVVSSYRRTTRENPRQEADDTLYPVSVISSEQDSQGRVKVHYIGYGTEFDEWRNPTGLLSLESPCDSSEKYDLHQDLALRIKAALSSSRKSNPVVKIAMAFDKETFLEGLGSVGYVHHRTKQLVRYRIAQFSDLDELLGKGWHFRGLNPAGDYCYVYPGTAEYYLRRRRPITHFLPTDNGVPAKASIPQGYMLYFTFVRGDGTPFDFGKNNSIFS